MSREQTLKLYLADLKKDYDYILIDCMPSLGMLTINALAAADSVIVPVQAHYLPLKGMTQLMKTIGKVQRQLNPKVFLYYQRAGCLRRPFLCYNTSEEFFLFPGLPVY